MRKERNWNRNMNHMALTMCHQTLALTTQLLEWIHYWHKWVDIFACFFQISVKAPIKETEGKKKGKKNSTKGLKCNRPFKCWHFRRLLCLKGTLKILWHLIELRWLPYFVTGEEQRPRSHQAHAHTQSCRWFHGSAWLRPPTCVCTDTSYCTNIHITHAILAISAHMNTCFNARPRV